MPVVSSIGLNGSFLLIESGYSSGVNKLGIYHKNNDDRKHTTLNETPQSSSTTYEAKLQKEKKNEEENIACYITREIFVKEKF